MIIEFMTMMNTAKIDQYEEAQKIKIVINLSCSTFAHADANLAFWPFNVFSGAFNKI